MTKQADFEKVMDSLPLAARKELGEFLAYLRWKYRADAPAVKLGRLWADIDFDVSDADVRELRRRATQQLVDKV